MIKDKLENVYRYSINNNFENFKGFLKDSQGMDLTKIVFPLKAIPLNYTTGEFNLSKFENHQKYIDIHYIVKGQEQIGLTQVSDLKPNIKYDQENDYQLFDGEVSEFIRLQEGEFLLLFPGEAHVTGGICNEMPLPLEKIVFKIPI